MARRLAAILAADVVGYGRLMAEDEAGTYGSLRSVLAEVVTPAVTRHGGRVFKPTGDGFLAAFGSVGEALDAAIDIQDGFVARPLKLRIGINLGDIIEEDGDVFGDGVNIASRLESMAEPGAIFVSAAVVRAAAKLAGRRFDRLRSRRGKNMAEAIEVYAVRWGDAAAARPARWPALPWRAAAAASVVALTGGAGWLYGHPLVAAVEDRLRGAGGMIVAQADDRPSVAVLPFDNLGPDEAQDYFSDGLTEDIITDLARHEELMVIARNSSFAFKDRAVDIRDVGLELGAGYVLEGSARRAGDQLRVNAQLIDAGTGAHLWSRTYDRPAADVFAVQTDLTTQIVASLISYVRDTEQAAAGARPTENLRAYDLVLQGRDRLHDPALDGGGLLAARELFQRAIAIDPGYATAHAQLGLTYIKDHMSRLTGPPDPGGIAAGLEHVREAVRLQPELALPYQVLSYGLSEGGDYAGGLRAAERAVELNPSDPESLMSLAKAQVRSGAYDEAVTAAAQARRLHPLAPQYFPYVHGQALYAADRQAEADEVLAGCLLRAPDEPNCLRVHVAVLVRLDRVEAARMTMTRLTAQDPEFSLSIERATRRFGNSPLMERYLADLAAAGAPEVAGQARRPAPLDAPV